MCHGAISEFGKASLSAKDIKDKRIIEVGSCDVNGSLRPYIEELKPSEYIGTDIGAGKCVDVVCNVENIIEKFGKESFDIVISTEMLEHVKDWKKAISNIKHICKKGGIILITTRSLGFPFHEYPGDFWRYEISDMVYIFSDCKILKIEDDCDGPGVLIKVKKPDDFAENDLRGYELYNIVTNKKGDREEGTVPNYFLEDNLSMAIEKWLIYHQGYCHNRNYRGLLMMKNPFDLIAYEDIIYEIKPTVIVEIGGLAGGSAIWLRDHTKTLLGKYHTKVISIDVDPTLVKNIEKFNNDRIDNNSIDNDKDCSKYLIGITGDCTSSDVINKVKQYISAKDVVLVIEDSAHYCNHTINVLNDYKDIVTVGSYFIVEDGIIDVLRLWGNAPGPMRAVEEWIGKNSNYIVDRSKERYIMTYNPKGFLKRIS